MARLKLLTAWVRERHTGQFIKLSGEPYFDHLATVADLVTGFMRFGYEIGLSHDLLEKTQTGQDDFYQALLHFGYQPVDAEYIVSTVIALTDIYTKAAFPDLKKSQRKALEEARSIAISPDAQTVKYADLIYNVKWMMKYDIAHARKYLQRKGRLLGKMNAGDPLLHRQVTLLIRDSLQNHLPL